MQKKTRGVGSTEANLPLVFLIQNFLIFQNVVIKIKNNNRWRKAKIISYKALSIEIA